MHQHVAVCFLVTCSAWVFLARQRRAELSKKLRKQLKYLENPGSAANAREGKTLPASVFFNSFTCQFCGL